MKTSVKEKTNKNNSLRKITISVRVHPELKIVEMIMLKRGGLMIQDNGVSKELKETKDQLSNLKLESVAERERHRAEMEHKEALLQETRNQVATLTNQTHGKFK